MLKCKGYWKKRHQTESLCGITMATVSYTQIVRLSKELGWINIEYLKLFLNPVNVVLDQKCDCFDRHFVYITYT